MLVLMLSLLTGVAEAGARGEASDAPVRLVEGEGQSELPSVGGAPAGGLRAGGAKRRGPVEAAPTDPVDDVVASAADTQPAGEAPADATEPAPAAPSDAAPSPAAPSGAEVSPEAAAPPAPAQPDVAAMKAQLEALSNRVAELEELLTYGPKSAPGVRKPPRPPTQMFGPNGFHVDLSGYYRTRGYVFGAKFGPEKPVTGGLYPDQETSGRYMNMRLRLGMALAWKDTASVNIAIQALDDVLWGDNNGEASVPLFAEDPSETRLEGGEAPPISVFRAWGEVKLPLGVVRVGRQSSHWGLGLLANAGDGFDDDFGENHYGNQFDRFLFATNPVSIVQALTSKKETTTVPLTFAIAVDRLVEDPLQQYYGYKCERGILQETSPDRYDPRCDSDGDGLTDREHDYKEERDPGDRTQDWWTNQNDDVWEMVYALIYRGQSLDWFGGGDFTVGGYLIHRFQKETESNVPVVDLYVDFKTNGFGFQFEGVGIFGKTRGITLPDSSNDADPLAKKAAIFGYAARLYYEGRRYKALLETGFASGDDNVNDGNFSGRALHPDYNVGLLLYEEVLARVTQNLWGEDAKGLRSKGGVYDSHYINPRFTFTPARDFNLIAGFLTVLPDKSDGSIVRCTAKVAETQDCIVPDPAPKSSILGWEADFAAKVRFADHFLFTMETGYAHATDRVALAAAGLQSNEKGGGNFWTFQSRFAWEL